MPTVTFLPADRSITVTVGTSLLDAAARAGVKINASCGGEGACGECAVQVESGSLEEVKRGCISEREQSEGWVLACGARVTDNVVIRVPEGEIEGGQIVTTGEAASPGPKPFSRAGSSEPLTEKRFLRVEPPSLNNSFSDLARLRQALKASGGPSQITTSLGVLRQLAAALRVKNHEVTATLLSVDRQNSAELIRIEPGDTTRRNFGLAIDVGTTTCAVQLVNLVHDSLMGTASDYNGQIRRGRDIISRINYAKSPERLTELRHLVLNNLNTLIETLCEENGIMPSEIDNAVVVGNTTMVHLLLGLDPEYIRLEPYSPTINKPPLLRGHEVGLAMNPEAFVRFAPGVGSYVGGDITAGLLQTPLVTNDEKVRLFLDIGTNGEIVVGNGEWLMACAASAGPAFEGSGVRCGMRAARGAIERVRINPETMRAEVSVIGGGLSRGICGSGMIDLLAELWTKGLLDPSGKLIPARGNGLIRPVEDSPRTNTYVIMPVEETEAGTDITIDEQDIQNLLRTKAAVYSACSLMLASVGLDFSAVSQVYVAGGFGRFLDISKAILIGMLPDMPPDRFTYLGNSALAGARAMLTSRAARAKALQLADRMTYLELNVETAYMDEYMAALFLPHTDIKRFPTVQRLLSHKSLA